MQLLQALHFISRKNKLKKKLNQKKIKWKTTINELIFFTLLKVFFYSKQDKKKIIKGNNLLKNQKKFR